MLGFFTAVTGLVSHEAMKNAILSSVPKGTEKLNESAFNKGYEHGKEVNN
jgi:2-oxoglutarate ferredoxin oxidoreductase subunit gamma